MKQPQNTGKLELQLAGTKQSSHNKNRSTNKNNSPSLQQTSAFLNKKIVSPQKLKILVLSGNELQNSELQFLSKCINLIKLDLSHNSITKLTQKQGIHKIQNLRVLNLQANKLLTTQSIQILFGMQSLEVFSFKQNPMQQDPMSQHEIVNSFPNLKVINYRVIFVEERDPYMMVERKPQFITKQFQQWQPAEHSQRYYLRVLKLQLQYVDNMWMFSNPIVKIQRIWRAVLQQRKEMINNDHTIISSAMGARQNNNDSTSYNATRHTAHPLNVLKAYESQSMINTIKIIEKNPTTEKQFLLKSCFRQWRQYIDCLRTIKQELRQQLYVADDVGNGDYLQQRKYQSHRQQQQQQTIFIEVENKQYLTFQLNDYYVTKRNLKIKHEYQRFLKKIRDKIYLKKMAQIFKRNIYKKVLSFNEPDTSFYTLSGIASTKKIYFNRVQQHLIENFLAHIEKKFKITMQKNKFGVANQYVAVRVLDPDTYASKEHYNPLTYLMWPCMRSVILKKKKFPFKNKSSIIKIKSLSYIKNLNKHLTLEQRKKSNKTYQRIDKFIQNQYHQGLGYLHCQNEQILKQLIRMIYYHNIKAIKYPKIIERSQMMSLLQSYQQNVSIYTEKLLERTTSAVKIQQQWRRYINNKRQSQTIYEKLKRNRAARLIQRFIRSRTFYHRLAFQRNLQEQLKFYDGKDIIVHQKLYKNLQNIIKGMESYIELYPGFKINIDKKITLYHQKFNSKQIFFPTLRSNHFQPRSHVSTTIPYQKIDIYKFLHFNSQTKIIECNNQRFYQFIFGSIQEAKLRVACFALLTYRFYGKQHMMLLSKSTLEKYNNYVKVYKNYGVECMPFESVSTVNKLKVNLLNDITRQSSCPFIYIDTNYQTLFNKQQLTIKKQMVVEFYQKKFQNFPQKYTDILHIVTQDQQEIREKQIQEKFFNLQKMLIKQSDIHENIEKFDKQKNEKTRSISEMDKFRRTKLNIVTPSVQISPRNSMNPILSDTQLQKEIISQLQNTNKKLSLRIKKTSQKQVSLDQIDNPPDITQKLQNIHSKTQTNYRTTYQQNNKASKKQKVTKYLQAEKSKRQSFKEQKQIELNKIRQKRKQQKVMNTTLKSFHQNERVEILKKKAQQVKQYKRRSLSNSKKDGDESQFIQQGNFIMQQNLRMNLMRQKLKQTERLNDKRRSLPKSLGNTQFLRRQSDDTKSLRSNHSFKQKKIFFDVKDTQIAEIDDKLNQTAKLQAHSLQQNSFRNTEQARKKSYVKKRSSKIGAYMRDPSLVHGVFPQEYYPIESSKGGITFPKVG